MAGPTNNKVPEHVWRVPLRVDEVPETGRHIELTADAEMREALARFARVDSVPSFSAVFDIVRRGKDGLRVTGEVTGIVGQTCIVTLEPMESQIVEPVDVVFEPPRPDADPVPAANPGALGSAIFEEEADPPEPLLGGVADLGALATEFLLLGIDPYPRKAGAAFESPVPNIGESGPFAALSRLKHGDDGKK